MIIDKKSWHYRLVFDSYGYGIDRMDSCEYIKEVVKATTLSIALFFLIIIVGYALLVVPLTYLAAVFMYGFFDDSLPIVVIGLYSLFGLLGLIQQIIKRVINKVDVTLKTPGFISQAHDRIKNKFCSKLEIIGD